MLEVREPLKTRMNWGPLSRFNEEKMEAPKRNGAVHPRSNPKGQRRVNQILNPVEGFSKSFGEQVGWLSGDADLPGGSWRSTLTPWPFLTPPRKQNSRKYQQKYEAPPA